MDTQKYGEIEVALANKLVEVSNGKLPVEQINSMKLDIDYAEPSMAICTALAASISDALAIPTDLWSLIQTWGANGIEMFQEIANAALTHAKTPQLSEA
jgi:hypothetical protein